MITCLVLNNMKQEYVDSSWSTITRRPLFSKIGYIPKELCLAVRTEWPYGNEERHETTLGWDAKYYTSSISLVHPLNGKLNGYLESVWEEAIEYYDVDVDVYEPYEVKKYVLGDSISDHVDQFYHLKPNERKLTMIVQLSGSEEYEGGDLSVAPMQVIDKTIGTVVVFPSFHIHSIKEISSGERWSLTSWAWGKHWK